VLQEPPEHKHQHYFFHEDIDEEKSEEKHIEPSLGLFSGPKLYIKVWFFPLEHKPYH
jgi:hypothetical protein